MQLWSRLLCLVHNVRYQAFLSCRKLKPEFHQLQCESSEITNISCRSKQLQLEQLAQSCVHCNSEYLQAPLSHSFSGHLLSCLITSKVKKNFPTLSQIFPRSTKSLLSPLYNPERNLALPFLYLSTGYLEELRPPEAVSR